MSDTAPIESADAPADGAEPTADIETLRLRLRDMEAQARDNYDRYVRERAETENFKKRMQRDKAEALRFANEPLIRDLLPVVDNLERALAHSTGEKDGLAQGVDFVLKALLEVLSRYGVTRIDALGQKFDPAIHQAVATVESDEHEPNTVLEQHTCGYRLHDRLLRPALTTVSAQKSRAQVETPPFSD